MGLGKITRGLGKVGLAFEALGYVWAAGGALVKAVKGASKEPIDSIRDTDESASTRRSNDRQEF
ncbi:hypothetical protein [Sphingobium yanoikuyae]|uniref:Uncharacterized protein n=1 Tax=Sphingobium yanoikuyae TaxID=13690 RepID=A0A3G2UUK9_SPHYA|nr:hypothetical protein [Sphingobium yanoikuyae]AYO78304.1 hypothetical protein EBF16_16265 [Sphingobium yanoikuyae]